MTLTFGPRIPHDGGPCPVAPDTVVKVWFANGDESSKPKTAGSWWWTYMPPARGYLIIAYAVAQPETPAQEPWTPYNNRVPCGLLTPKELAALMAEGPWERFLKSTEWVRTPGPACWERDDVIRTVKPRKAREVVMHAKRDGAGKWWAYESPERPEQWPWVFTLTDDANGEPVAVGNLRRKDAAP